MWPKVVPGKRCLLSRGPDKGGFTEYWFYHTAPVNATTPCTNGDVRLADGLSSNQGRVEICYNNQWGTVCDNYFTNIDARVVCRQLGFPALGEQEQN